MKKKTKVVYYFVGTLLALAIVQYKSIAQPQNELERRFSSWFYQKTGKSTCGLYNGEIYPMRSQSVNSHQFYLSKYWGKGTIWYLDQTYYNVELVYDIHQKKVVIRHPELVKRDGILLDISQIKKFEINGHNFLKMNEEQDFVEVVYQGINFHFLAQRNKTLETTSTGNKYKSVNHYFISFSENHEELIEIKSKTLLKTYFPNRYKGIVKALNKEKQKFNIYNETKIVGFIQGFDEKLD